MEKAEREQERRRARHQLAALVLILAGITAVATWAAHAPADAAELRIAVGELRSQAAELEAIDEERSAGKLDDALVREHIRQLAKVNGNSFRELARLRVEQSLADQKSQALADGRQLVSLVSTFEAGWPAEARELLKAVHDRLDERESALRS